MFDGSQLNADNPITIIANNISFQSNAGSFTSTKEITITPATITNNISVGAATGDGLNISQTTFSKMQAPTITLGGSGYEGTITVENLTGTPGRLNLIADGTGGAINISGDLDLDGKDASGISLYIQGSGATTDLSGTITTAGAAIVADAVRLVGDTNINTSGGSVTITGGTDGIYSQLDKNFNLSINAGAGSIFVGNTTGFGDNSGSDSLVGTVVLDSTSSIWLGDGNQSIGNDLDVLNATLVLEGNTNLSLNSLSGVTSYTSDLSTGVVGNNFNLNMTFGQVSAPTYVNLGEVSAVNELSVAGVAGSIARLDRMAA